MSLTPVGAVIDLMIGIGFLLAAGVSVFCHSAAPAGAWAWGVMVDLAVGLGAVAGVVSSVTTGTPRTLLWVGASVAWIAAMAVLAHRDRFSLNPTAEGGR